MRATGKISSSPRTLITGATGLLGHHVLAELLHRRQPCAALVRGLHSAAIARLQRLLNDLDVDIHEAIQSGLLRLLNGDLNSEGELLLHGAFDRIVHCAASTRFTAHQSGEPGRTNVLGTAKLLDAAARVGIREFHHVSTAYVCGRTSQPVSEHVCPTTPDSHNDYEHSKWKAEQLCVAWAKAHGARLTIYRPSIIVGAFDSGRTTKFDGFYLTARATELIERRCAKQRHPNDMAARRISLRVRARAEDRQNIVPVDWVARMIAAIALEPALHGRTYHLVNPSPPTNRTIQHAIEDHFDIIGSTLVAPECYPASGLSADERIFEQISRTIAHYMVDTPRFERANTCDAESHLGLRCPTYDTEALKRLVRYAQSANWGKTTEKPAPEPTHATGYAHFFERFLPANISRSRVARAAAVNATIRFVIGDDPRDDWLCRFDNGNLVEVLRAEPHVRADIGYRASRSAFWSAISGRVHPEELFVSGEAEIFGDSERALKMVMILNAFSREFPFDEQSPLQHASKRRSA